MALSTAAALLGGSVASGLLGAGSNVVGSFLSYKQQKKLIDKQAKTNYSYSIKSAKNLPSANRAGLENAGYNPMLAVQNATSGANSSWASQSSANAPDIAGGISSGVANAQSFQRLKNETEATESLNDKNYAEADLAKANKAKAIEELPYVSKQAKADYMKTSMEAAKLENDIHYQDEYLNYLDKSLEIQDKLGMMGIDVQKRGQDKVYNATMYANRTERYKRSKSFGFGGLNFNYSGVDRLRLRKNK